MNRIKEKEGGLNMEGRNGRKIEKIYIIGAYQCKQT